MICSISRKIPVRHPFAYLVVKIAVVHNLAVLVGVGVVYPSALLIKVAVIDVAVFVHPLSVLIVVTFRFHVELLVFNPVAVHIEVSVENVAVFVNPLALVVVTSDKFGLVFVFGLDVHSHAETFHARAHTQVSEHTVRLILAEQLLFLVEFGFDFFLLLRFQRESRSIRTNGCGNTVFVLAHHFFDGFFDFRLFCGFLFFYIRSLFNRTVYAEFALLLRRKRQRKRALHVSFIAHTGHFRDEFFLALVVFGLLLNEFRLRFESLLRGFFRVEFLLFESHLIRRFRKFGSRGGRHNLFAVGCARTFDCRFTQIFEFGVFGFLLGIEHLLKFFEILFFRFARRVFQTKKFVCYPTRELRHRSARHDFHTVALESRKLSGRVDTFHDETDLVCLAIINKHCKHSFFLVACVEIRRLASKIIEIELRKYVERIVFFTESRRANLISRLAQTVVSCNARFVEFRESADEKRNYEIRLFVSAIFERLHQNVEILVVVQKANGYRHAINDVVGNKEILAHNEIIIAKFFERDDIEFVYAD